MAGYTIGQLGRAAGVGVETIRYYERRGLLERPTRPGGRTRRDSAEALRQVRFIKRAQALGFTLRDVGDRLELRLTRQTSCAEIRPRAAAKLSDIAQKLRDLESMRKALQGLVDRCDRACGDESPLESCPILDVLEDASEQRRRVTTGRRHLRVGWSPARCGCHRRPWPRATCSRRRPFRCTFPPRLWEKRPGRGDEIVSSHLLADTDTPKSGFRGRAALHR